MKNLVLCITLNLLFFINFVYTDTVQVAPVQSRINFQGNSDFSLTCNVTYDGDQKPTIEWYKDSKKVSEIDSLKGRISQDWDKTKHGYFLTVERATDADKGNYSCRAYQGAEQVSRANVTVTNIILAVKVPSNVNVVEEERLRIECKVSGELELYWKFGNDTYDVSRDRIILENYTDEGKVIRNGVFIIEKITNDDRGEAVCVGKDIVGKKTYEDICMVRVKGKYAALWPFLGICAEVIVLCAIIVIYEKKRNKTELEESDTDQSPDQKNTPDHGKDSNLRHRQ